MTTHSRLSESSPWYSKVKLSTGLTVQIDRIMEGAGEERKEIGWEVREVLHDHLSRPTIKTRILDHMPTRRDLEDIAKRSMLNTENI